MYLVSALLSYARRRYDVDSLTIRHTDADLLLSASSSLMSVLGCLADHGCTDYLTVASATSGTGATSPRNGTIVQPSVTVPARRICKVEVLESGEWRDVPSGNVNAETDYSVTSPGPPDIWIPCSQDGVVVPTADTTTIGTQRFMLLPATNSAYTLRVRYVPDITLLSTDKLAIDALEYEWIVSEIGVYLASRDEEIVPGVLNSRMSDLRFKKQEALRAAVGRNHVFGNPTRQVRALQTVSWLYRMIA